MAENEFALGALLTFIGYTVLTFVLAWASQRVLVGGNFLSEYFLGSRGLGVVAFTLTFAATNASAGSFAGFPSLIYTHGWVLSLWIAGFMLVPLFAMGLMGKRLNQVARRAGAITLPDILRERFQSPAIALLASLLMVVLLSFYLIPQFKLAALILRQLLTGTSLLAAGAQMVDAILPPAVERDYAFCLFVFAALVVVYTTYGGFRAVVWTDVMQGLVMIGGLMVMLALTFWVVGSLESVNEKLAVMVPPRLGTVTFVREAAAEAAVRLPSDLWLIVSESTNGGERLLRTNEAAYLAAGETESRPIKTVEVMTAEEIARLREGWEGGRPPALPSGVAVRAGEFADYSVGAGQPSVYVRPPGPVPPLEGDAHGPGWGFLPLGVAVSFFLFWPLSATGQPGNMVRLMAFDSTRTLQRSIACFVIFNGLVYIPLVMIFCSARVLLPGLDSTPDRIMPAMAYELARLGGVPWLAGLLLAVPFAAAMSTVDSFMLMISSAVVRDFYQRQINPNATELTVERLSYLSMLVAGALVTYASLNPPKFMQYLIVFASGGLSVTFLVPMLLALYWPRANATGVLAAMIGGLTVYLLPFAIGFLVYGKPRAVEFLSLDPTLWGFLASLVIGVLVSRATAAPDAVLVARFFQAAPASPAERGTGEAAAST